MTAWRPRNILGTVHQGERVIKPLLLKRLVAVMAMVVLALAVYYQHLATATTADRLILWSGLVFAGLVLCRQRGEHTEAPQHQLAAAAAAGTLVAVTGTIVPVHQFEWLGLLLLLYAALRWSLPVAVSGNAASALVVLYWAHPLPGAFFGAVRLALQRLSVAGAEWALHAFHIPVWADGLLLRTGSRLFQVPEACSGMNTAMIVVVCALGAGALTGLSLARRVVLIGAGLLQVLLMNAARIALMVALAQGKPAEWSAEYLHDSTSALLLIMIVLIQGEAVLWQRAVGRRIARQAARSRDQTAGLLFREPGPALPRLEVAATDIPFSRLGRALRIILPVALLLALAWFFLDHRTPAYRAAMIAVVSDELALQNLEQGERAAQAAAALDPGELAHVLRLAQFELVRGRYDDALARLERIPPARRNDTAVQLMAWGLLGSGRIDKARDLLSRLPQTRAAHPGLAMCATELAVARRDPDAAASNIVMAAASPLLIGRVRNIYPFLFQYGKWGAIVRTYASAPYVDATEFRIMLVALVNENELGLAARLLRTNRALWFGRPDFLPNLQRLALRAGTKEAQQGFTDSLTQCLSKLTTDELTACIEPCFQLGRPDLAWLVYQRLLLTDPSHPALTLIPARLTPVGALAPTNTADATTAFATLVDLRPFFRIADTLDPAQRLQQAIRLDSFFIAGPAPDQLSGWSKTGLDELARRETSGTLSFEEYALYAKSLQWAARDTDVLDTLDRMERRFPDRRVEVLSLRAEFYVTRQQWQLLYETLRQIKALRPHLDRAMHLIMTETLARLEMGVCAIEMADDAARQRPTEREGHLLLAKIWAQFGYAAEALFALRAIPHLPPSELRASLLWQTGQYAQADLMYDIVGIDRKEVGRPTAMPLLPPADSVLSWPAPEAPPFTPESLEAQIRLDTSPFFLRFHTLTRTWLQGQDRTLAGDLALWKGAGRDTLEQVTALHRLAFLAAADGDMALASRALHEALQLMPTARLLWRMQIAVADGDAAVIDAARSACPEDPEIWLAEFASQLRANRVAAAGRSLRSACAAARYSPAVMVRAGQAILQRGDAVTAALAADYASGQWRGYLPADVLGLDAAVASGHLDKAIALALSLSEQAPDNMPFLRLAVRLGMTRDKPPLPLLHALDTLISREPENPEWALRLGTIYFNDGSFKLARRAFGHWLLSPPEGTPAGLLIMMSESARLSGDLPRSVAILRDAFRRYPGNLHVINSLAYTLAQSPATIEEGRAFLPFLINAPPSAAIQDTIAALSLNAEEVAPARELSRGPEVQTRAVETGEFQ